MKIVRPITINDAALSSTNILENDYGAYNAGTAYGLGDRVIVVSTDIHDIYESLQAANTGHTPASSPTWWIRVGSTNRWKMFDASMSSQSSRADLIDVTLALSERIDSVALLNASASTVQVTMTATDDGVVFDETYSMVSDSGITDWWAYFFEPIIRKTDLYVTGLPPYGDSTVRVQLADSGATVLLGECVVGLSRDIGDTEYGASVGIQDYSVKQQNDFGDYTILERAYSKRGSFTVWIPAYLTSEVQRLLAQYRATPIVYIGSDDIGALYIYGFFREFDIELALSSHSLCSIEIEGLT